MHILFFVGVGVKLVMDIAKALVGYVSVNLSCCDIRVTKKFLDTAKIDTLIH